jgi:hypothetical protein
MNLINQTPTPLFYSLKQTMALLNLPRNVVYGLIRRKTLRVSGATKRNRMVVAEDIFKILDDAKKPK